MFKLAAGFAAVGLLLSGPAWAQPKGATVTVVLEGVQSNEGNVGASLCDDPKAPFPGRCSAHQGVTKATAGETIVTIKDVPPGRYALQAFHDKNSDFIPEIPPEGYAFGNDAPWPASFKDAAIQVSGDARIQVRMTYIAGASQARRTGSHGAAPPEGVTRTDVRQDGLYGELYTPAHKKRLPAIILMGGSEGGLDVISGMAGGFAKQGYATLALAYWAEEGLPSSLELIPLEYFDRAVAWLKARPDVDPHAIGAMGWSRGSEAVLLLGARNPDVRAVVAVAPSGIVWRGLNFSNVTQAKAAWTAGGKPLPFVTPDGTAYRPNAPMRTMFTKAFAEADRRPETAIPVERIHGPILLISGGDDHLWPSREMADRMMARLKAAKFPYAYQHLTYDGAGHAVFVGEPDGPMAKALGTPSPMLGGSAEADAKAWADDWPKVVAFYDKALKERAR